MFHYVSIFSCRMSPEKKKKKKQLLELPWYHPACLSWPACINNTSGLSLLNVSMSISLIGVFFFVFIFFVCHPKKWPYFFKWQVTVTTWTNQWSKTNQLCDLPNNGVPLNSLFGQFPRTTLTKQLRGEEGQGQEDEASSFFGRWSSWFSI